MPSKARHRLQRRWFGVVRPVALAWVLTSPAAAHVTEFADHRHEAGKTFTAIALSLKVVRVLFTVPVTDIARLAAEAGTATSADAYRAFVRRGLALDNLGVPCVLEGIHAVDYDAIAAYQFTLDFRCTEAPDFLTFHYALFADDSTHENFTEVILGSHVLQVVLGEQQRSLDIPVAHLVWDRGASWRLPAEPPALPGAKPSLAGYFALGFEHVLGGYDHIAFVIALVLVVGRFRELAIAITAFTLAHSITLGASAAGVWVVPATITEPLIAFSILYVGAENLFVLWQRRRHRRADADMGHAALSRRWLLAFGFGLVHGFGFSYLLRTIGLPQSEFFASLALFNLGVEAGQISFVAPLFVLLRVWDYGRRLHAVSAAVGSALILLLAAYWLGERLSAW